MWVQIPRLAPVEPSRLRAIGPAVKALPARPYMLLPRASVLAELGPTSCLEIDMPRISAEQAGGANVCAFLDMLAVSEIGTALLANPLSDGGYRVLVGSTASKPLLFSSYATHPNVFNRATNSTAAGRYQLLNRYWVAYKASLRLRDFSPVSQDLIAIQQIKERQAINMILAGDFKGAVTAVSNIWASLPGAGYGQHENSMASLQAAYVAAGGVVA